MKISSNKQKPLLAVLIALAVATPVAASAASSSSSSGTPVVATNGQRPPGPYGSVRDFGDVQRAEIQQHVQGWPWENWRS